MRLDAERRTRSGRRSIRHWFTMLHVPSPYTPNASSKISPTTTAKGSRSLHEGGLLLYRSHERVYPLLHGQQRLRFAQASCRRWT